MTKKIILYVLLFIVAVVPTPTSRPDIRIGSKKFTESVILGEMLRLLVLDTGSSVEHLRELGGTRLVYEALRQGEIDAYPEYTGTLLREIFAEADIQSEEELRDILAKDGIRMSQPLGFNNSYALGMRKEHAERLGVTQISDLVRYPELKYGFSNEFLERDDGWPGLRAAYGLTTTHVTGLDHDVAYKQLQLGLIDVIDVYTTDARIEALDLAVLADDRHYFPRYDAVILYRADLDEKLIDALRRLEGQLSESAMIACNGRVELAGKPEATVAADYLAENLGVTVEVKPLSTTERIIKRTFEHLDLVRRSLLPAILLGIPLGVVAAKRRWFGRSILGVTGIIQTIPALALLVMLMPLAAWAGFGSVGAGSGTAIIALFLYSLLPIVQSTYTGVTSVDHGLIESAEVLNLPGWYRLMEIELPLASRSILSGVKTAAVINVGFATLGALVGAGGYGQPIFSGIRLTDTALILQGAIPAAVMALGVQGLFEIAERFMVPRGLRLKPGDTATTGGQSLQKST